jgi:hypothetical protein
MGEYLVLFSKLTFGEAIWFKLYSTTSEEVTGELKLKFAKTNEELYRRELDKNFDSIMLKRKRKREIRRLVN